MGYFTIEGQARTGTDVQKYEGWKMAMIIRDFLVDKPTLDEYDRGALRRALLVSYEFNCVNKGVRFDV